MRRWKFDRVGIVLAGAVALGGYATAQTPKPAPAPATAAVAAPARPSAAAAAPAPASPVPAPAAAAPPAAADTEAKAKPKKPLVPAKVLFGAVKSPAPLAARAIGFYSKGCLAGARAVPIDGPAWQVMRLSRNRNWGHPTLTAWVQRFARDAQTLEGWSGLLVGDLSQPRGGPMLTGHASHQVGLDADLWFTPMPAHRMSSKEREDLAATSMLPEGNPRSVEVDPKVWSEKHVRLVRRAANYGDVERILVHPAIKKALCDGATALGPDRTWLAKVRPYWGHHYHFHVRMGCPPDNASCKAQAPIPPDDGCGKELTDWLALVSRPPKPPGPPPEKPVKPAPPKPQMTLNQLPPECRTVLGPYAQGG